MRFLTFEEELAIDDEAIEKMRELHPVMSKEDIKKLVFRASSSLSSGEKELRQQFSEIWREISRRTLGKTNHNV